jgi:hypothetical protein
MEDGRIISEGMPDGIEPRHASASFALPVTVA